MHTQCDAGSTGDSLRGGTGFDAVATWPLELFQIKIRVLVHDGD
jgi:hypothetical protein